MVNCQTSYSSLQEMNEGWTFQVYSPSKQVLAIIILQGKEPRLLREIAALYPQTALPLSDWVMDSQDAMSTWWKNGGSTIWGRENSEGVHLFLGLNTEAQMVWQVTVTQKGSEDLSYWEIAADNAVGQVLERYYWGCTMKNFVTRRTNKQGQSLVEICFSSSIDVAADSLERWKSDLQCGITCKLPAQIVKLCV